MDQLIEIGNLNAMLGDAALKLADDADKRASYFLLMFEHLLKPGVLTEAALKEVQAALRPFSEGMIPTRPFPANTETYKSLDRNPFVTFAAGNGACQSRDW